MSKYILKQTDGTEIGRGESARQVAEKYRANLLNADLRCANLRYANLLNADLRYANLHNADLHNAYLRKAHLRCANLHNADLLNANLRCANLHNADLRKADLRYANLRYADLLNANLRCANLHGIRHTYSSHDLIAEILRQAAGGNAEHRAYAGLVAVSKDWCWEQFHELNHPGRDWAYGVLVDAAHEDDELPEVLRDFKAGLSVESEGE